MVRNQLPAQVVNHFYYPKIAIFSQFQVYLSMIQAKQTINLLHLNNFYPVMSYERVQRGKRQIIAVRSLVMVRNQLPAQLVDQSPV